MQISDQILASLAICVIGYAALFAINIFAAGAALTLPLLPLLYAFQVAVRAAYSRAIDTLSVHAAADIDRADQVRDLTSLPLDVQSAPTHRGWSRPALL